MRRTRARVFAACVLVATVQVVVWSPHAQAQTGPADGLGDKEAQAAALREKIAAQGRKLSLADEQYNQARIARQRIAAQAQDAAADVAASDQRWRDLKAQLAQRVRMLYMHPGAQIDVWLGSTSVQELARKQKFGSEVLTADSELVDSTERARREVMARAERLDGIQDAAAGKEAEMASKRSEIDEAVGEQRALLGQVNGEIAEIMEEQRQAELEAARRAAEEAARNQPQPTPAPNGGGGGGGGILPGASPAPAPTPAEPAGPPPPVSGGAGEAVAAAAAEIGKPYEWAADGPDSYDCSGLTMHAWGVAGVSMPHSSQAQFASFPKVARAQLRPGDLVFFGSPIHHVGIYEGGGTMINAPETGEHVRRDSIGRADYAGAVRPG